MGFIAILWLSIGLGACQTLPKAKFPSHFNALQKISVIPASAQSFELLVQLQQKKSEFSILFLDPILMEPILKLDRQKNQKVIIHRFDQLTLKIPEEHLLDVFHSLASFYANKNSYGFSYEETQPMSSCSFPRSLRYAPSSSFEVRVKTLEVECKSQN